MKYLPNYFRKGQVGNQLTQLRSRHSMLQCLAYPHRDRIRRFSDFRRSLPPTSLFLIFPHSSLLVFPRSYPQAIRLP